MSSRAVRTNTRLRRREEPVADVNGAQNDIQRDQQVIGQAPLVPQNVSGPPMIDLDVTDDDDVVESTASAFAQAKNKSTSSRRGPVIVDVESGRLSRSRSRLRSDHDTVECDQLKKSRKSEAIAPDEEPKFNCPICLCPFTEEMSTKCGHIFCNKCIKNAISLQAKCPTCRKKVRAKDLIRVFLPTVRPLDE